MTDDIDIYRAAKVMIDRHGDDAPVHAAVRADAMLDRGDMEARAVWLRIRVAVEEMLRTEAGGVVH